MSNDFREVFRLYYSCFFLRCQGFENLIDGCKVSTVGRKPLLIDCEVASVLSVIVNGFENIAKFARKSNAAKLHRICVKGSITISGK